MEHEVEVQEFKKQKEPHLFHKKQRKAPGAKASGISFARDAILRKRPADVDTSFGGWAKKEKPEPPPCDQPGFYDDAAEPVITAPPWLSQPKPSNEEATDVDKEVDKHVTQAQLRRFSKRNVLEVNNSTVRCKLCYKTLGSVTEAEQHIVNTHRDDFAKELEIWNRFLFTSCRRQPPFGWVCKICNIFFPSDGAVWRHLGKEVYLRQEERHLDTWHQREDRWGHEEDEECCGDGINFARGLSYDSVKKFNEEARKLREEVEMKTMLAGQQGSGENDSDEDAEEPKTAEDGRKTFIEEF